MRKKIIVSGVIVVFIVTGCVQNPLLPSHLNNAGGEQKALIFKTNQSTFINELNSKTTKNIRNSYMNEFILKSDIQCQKYLATPIVKSTPTNAKNTLYMNIFDTVSTVFGIKYITDTAKVMLSGEQQSSLDNQQAYKNAFSPEIQRGVEINRVRYAKKLQRKQPKSLKEYPIIELQQEMLIYDKQCNEEYGLIEINRALKAMQQNINRPPVDNKPKINVEAIKNKVAKVTKEVKKKEEVINKEETKSHKETNATTKKLPL
jgi:hypothetical protein